MSAAPVLQLAVVLAAVLVCVKPLGLYIASVMDGRPPKATRLVARLERRIYLVAGIEPAREMDWQGYALALLMFNGLGTLAVYAFQRLQHLLPLNPQGLGPVFPQSAFNTAISFVTNTNWQGYAGETTMSYLTQMAALTVQNFLWRPWHRGCGRTRARILPPQQQDHWQLLGDTGPPSTSCCHSP